MPILYLSSVIRPFSQRKRRYHRFPSWLQSREVPQEIKSTSSVGAWLPW